MDTMNDTIIELSADDLKTIVGGSGSCIDPNGGDTTGDGGVFIDPNG